MKTLLFGALLLFIGTGLQAQGHDVSPKNVPQGVLSDFSQNFSQARDVEWEVVYGDYRASFEVGDVEHHAVFTSDGKLISHTYEIPGREVPPKVQAAFAEKFKNASDMEWEKEMENAEENGAYEVSFEQGEEDHKAYFSEAGALIKHAFEITAGALPSDVVEKIKKDYPDYKIGDVTRIEPEKKEDMYEVELDGQPDLNLRYDKKGHVLMKMVDHR